ncbi:EF-P beta-lysylation protein EpmB [Acidiferrobacter sp.]|uniref:EF-P beta-lysylation protein EpmB n=1 Tax=Acidiferrobacter sp. TaxID=1872107 RepID=UPI00261B2A91|nr:EF-P beta-lysylation protein EpmB [Acidiferrobacter sp.]
MIHRTDPARQAPWQAELAAAIRDPEALIRALGLPEGLCAAARIAHGRFPVRVPPAYLARIRPGDPRDPLLRQVLPLDCEQADQPGFSKDPVGDLAAQVAPGVLRKYEGRVLLTATGACAVHCRYCFRRHFPYAQSQAARDRWQAASAHIAADRSIREVILSGGDPLTLSDDRLADLMHTLRGIPHIERVRFHTRVPVVIPSRVDEGLLGWLDQARAAVVMVLHINHPQEIDEAVISACARLKVAGVTLLNQAVLLAGVNDDADVLAALSERAFAAGVLPYYLHMLDCVEGARHFAVDAARAAGLLEVVRARLPGYLVPRLVREQAGAPAKVPVPAVGAAIDCR